MVGTRALSVCVCVCVCVHTCARHSHIRLFRKALQEHLLALLPSRASRLPLHARVPEPLESESRHNPSAHGEQGRPPPQPRTRWTWSLSQQMWTRVGASSRRALEAPSLGNRGCFWLLLKWRVLENQDGGVGRHTVPPRTTRTDRKSNGKGVQHQGNTK